MEFFINAEDVETQKPRVFHNEDTRWGFPWYFKFNSAEKWRLQAASMKGQGLNDLPRCELERRSSHHKGIFFEVPQ